MTVTEMPAPTASPGLFLRMARDFAGLSQTELAAKLGVDASTIIRAENGAVGQPRQERIIAWAFACGVRPDWLQWNIDACTVHGMSFDLRPRGEEYTPRDSNPEPAVYALAA